MFGLLRFVPACGLAESRRPFVRNGVLRDPVPDGQGSDSVAGGTAALPPPADRRDAAAPPLGGSGNGASIVRAIISCVAEPTNRDALLPISTWTTPSDVVADRVPASRSFRCRG